jgi:hypothetical protein
VIAEEVSRLDDVLQRKARALMVRLPASNEPELLLDDLFGLLDGHRGDCEVFIEMYLEGNVIVRARPHNALRVRGSLDLEGALRKRGCQVEWLNVTLGHL